MGSEFEPLRPEKQLGYLIVRAAEVVSKPWLHGLRAHGINPRQFSVLSIVAAADGGLSQAELARRSNITPQSIGELLNALERSELISRGEQMPGRAVGVSVTARGQEVLAAAYPVVQRLQEQSLAMLDARERDTLAALLLRVIGSRADASRGE